MEPEALLAGPLCRRLNSTSGGSFLCGGLFSQLASICKASAFRTLEPGTQGRQSGRPRRCRAGSGCGGVKGTASAAWVLNFPEENNYTRLGSCSWQRQLPEELPWVRESEPEMWAAGPPMAAGNPVRIQGKDTPDTESSRGQEHRTENPVRVGKAGGKARAAPGPWASP